VRAVSPVVSIILGLSAVLALVGNAFSGVARSRVPRPHLASIELQVQSQPEGLTLWPVLVSPMEPGTIYPFAGPLDVGPPTPTVTSTPTASAPLPLQAHVSRVNSYPQSLGLDCEARSAVDWAAFWGLQIDELEFFQEIPRSDDPRTGFVGDPNGLWGQVPPHGYGVYAGPIAALLRAHGVPAQAEVGLRFDDLKREIAAGHPVILWVAGHVGSGTPEPYTSSDGATTVVTPYEHTVLLIGYDTGGVTILDEGMSYRRSLADFLLSWSALDNMAVVRPAVEGDVQRRPVYRFSSHGLTP
jgi:uncharacterized protein YvpB